MIDDIERGARVYLEHKKESVSGKVIDMYYNTKSTYYKQQGLWMLVEIDRTRRPSPITVEIHESKLLYGKNEKD